MKYSFRILNGRHNILRGDHRRWESKDLQHNLKSTEGQLSDQIIRLNFQRLSTRTRWREGEGTRSRSATPQSSPSLSRSTPLSWFAEETWGAWILSLNIEYRWFDENSEVTTLHSEWTLPRLVEMQRSAFRQSLKDKPKNQLSVKIEARKNGMENRT